MVGAKVTVSQGGLGTIFTFNCSELKVEKGQRESQNLRKSMVRIQVSEKVNRR